MSVGEEVSGAPVNVISHGRQPQGVVRIIASTRRCFKAELRTLDPCSERYKVQP